MDKIFTEGKNECRLDKLAYETMLVKLSAEDYEPTPVELKTTYYWKDKCFTIIREKNNNYLVYIRA